MNAGPLRVQEKELDLLEVEFCGSCVPSGLGARNQTVRAIYTLNH